MKKPICDHCGASFEHKEFVVMLEASKNTLWFDRAFVHAGCQEPFILRVQLYINNLSYLQDCWRLDAVIPRGVPTD